MAFGAAVGVAVGAANGPGAPGPVCEHLDSAFREANPNPNPNPNQGWGWLGAAAHVLAMISTAPLGKLPLAVSPG